MGLIKFGRETRFLLVSAILRGRNPRAVIQFIIDASDYSWMVSPEILTEYKEVLNRPKLKLKPEIIAEWGEVLDTVPILVDVELEVDFPRDRKDAKFIACAKTVNADFLITGDRDFTEAKILGKTRIISVSLFKELFVDTITNH